MTQELPKPERREFKITRKLLEKHGYQSDCSGCDAVLPNARTRLRAGIDWKTKWRLILKMSSG